MVNDNINIEDIQYMEYGSDAFGASEFGSQGLTTCPTSPRYSGDDITLSATPRDGTGPYYVVFRKNEVNINPSRLGGSDNPIINAPEDVEITRVYTLNDLDISSASGGTIDFSVYIEDSCPTGPMSCTETCTITIGCIAPVCNFTVT